MASNITQRHKNTSSSPSYSFSVHIKPVHLEMPKEHLVKYFKQFGKNFVLLETTKSQKRKRGKNTTTARTFNLRIGDAQMFEEVLRIEHSLEDLDLHFHIANKSQPEVEAVLKKAFERKRVTVKVRDVPVSILKTEDYSQLLKKLNGPVLSHVAVTSDSDFYRKKPKQKEEEGKEEKPESNSTQQKDYKCNVFVEMDLKPDLVSDLMQDRKFVTIVSECSRNFKIYQLRMPPTKKPSVMDRVQQRPLVESGRKDPNFIFDFRNPYPELNQRHYPFLNYHNIANINPYGESSYYNGCQNYYHPQHLNPDTSHNSPTKVIKNMNSSKRRRAREYPLRFENTPWEYQCSKWGIRPDSSVDAKSVNTLILELSQEVQQRHNERNNSIRLNRNRNRIQF